MIEIPRRLSWHMNDTMTRDGATDASDPESPGHDRRQLVLDATSRQVTVDAVATVPEGQRIDGMVRVTDRPARRGGRAYLVERGLETKSELDALIADYLQQATKLETPPLAVCPLGSNLEANAWATATRSSSRCISPAPSPTQPATRWQQSLSDAIRAEAETIADYAGSDLLRPPGPVGRTALRHRIVAEMTAALRQAGDTYTAPDGIAYTLTEQAELALPAREGTLASMSPASSAPVVEEVLRFEDLPLGSSGTRAAIVRWSDGTESQALARYGDEILFCEGDHGNSRLMSSRVEMRGVVGSVGARRAT
jgi:hypothetical protein